MRPDDEPFTAADFLTKAAGVAAERETPPDVLSEAYEIIRGDRLKIYGPPDVNIGRIAALWSAYLEADVSMNDVCALMVLLKQARGRAGYNRDNSVDTAGYAGLQEIVNAAEEAPCSHTT